MIAAHVDLGFLWWLYVIPAVGTFWMVGRDIYQNGTRDRIVRPGSIGGSLFFAVAYGAAWPYYWLIAALVALLSRESGALARRMFDRAWGR